MTAEGLSPEPALDGGGGTATDPALLATLRSLGDQYGPLGVALAAADLTDSAVLVRRLTETSEPADDEPALPEGEYARVEIMGHDYHTGWVTERDRAGVRVLAIADWDGRVLAEVPGQSLYRYVPLPTPLKRPEVAAITRANPDYDGDGWDSRDDDGDLDDEDEEGPF